METKNQSLDIFLNDLEKKAPQLISSALKCRSYHAYKSIEIDNKTIKFRLLLLKFLLQKNSCTHCGKKAEVIEFKKEAKKDHYYFTVKNKGSYFNIDHIWPKAAGGSNEEINLTLSCVRCNLEKDSKILLITLMQKEKDNPGFINNTLENLIKKPFKAGSNDLVKKFNIWELGDKIKNKHFFGLLQRYQYDLFEAFAKDYKNYKLLTEVKEHEKEHYLKIQKQAKFLIDIKEKVKGGEVISFIKDNFQPGEKLFNKLTVAEAVWLAHGFEYIPQLYQDGYGPVHKDQIIKKIASFPHKEMTYKKFVDVLQFLIKKEEIKKEEIIKRIELIISKQANLKMMKILLKDLSTDNKKLNEKSILAGHKN